MSTWQDAPDASGLWWRDWGNGRSRFDVVEVTVDENDGDVWFRDEGGDYTHISKHPPVRWSRVVTPERVEALESALREVCDAHRSRLDPDDDNWCRRCGAHWTGEEHGHGCPVGRALAVLRGTVAGEKP